MYVAPLSIPSLVRTMMHTPEVMTFFVLNYKLDVYKRFALTLFIRKIDATYIPSSGMPRTSS